MVRRRRFKAAYLLGSLLLLAASLHPTTAYSAPGDPPSGSPAGAVYQLPLEQGRSDAAPKGNGGTGAEAGSGGGGAGGGSVDSASGEAGESSSLYRSENNFGSSSRVPGVAATGAATGAGDPGGASGGASGGGGQGGAGAAAGSAAIAGGVVAAETADNGNTSIPASIVLLGAIALLAIAVGILSRRHARRSGTSN